MTNGEKFKEVFGFGVDGSRVIAVNAIWWDCQFQDSKPSTNADRIRQMTDEELADWLALEHNDCDTCPIYAGSCEDGCKKKWLDWLKQESES